MTNLTSSFVAGQPDADAIFDNRHVEVSYAPCVSGIPGNLWFYDGFTWRFIRTKEETNRLLCLAEKYGTPIHSSMWEFPSDFDFHQECSDGDA